jgi:hypothetical protein
MRTDAFSRRITMTVASAALGFAGLCFVIDRPALGANPGPGWAIRSIASPTNFSSTASAACAGAPRSHLCDSYRLLVTNVGDAPTNEPLTISDVLPSDVTAVSITAEDLGQELEQSSGCTLAPLQCVVESPLAAGDTLLVIVNVTVAPGTPEQVLNQATVSGGGAPSAVTTSESTTVGPSKSPFGIENFSVQPFDATGSPDAQAGGHPYSLLTGIDLNTFNEIEGEEGHYFTPAEVKDFVVDLPLGLIGNPQALPTCPLNALLLSTGKTACPPASRIGTVVFQHGPGFFAASEGPSEVITAIYNMTPEAGYPAEFGFTYDLHPSIMYANVVRINGSYMLRITSPGVPVLGVNGVSLLFFGNPGERDTSGMRGGEPFFTNPVNCLTEPLEASVQIASWRNPSVRISKETTVYPAITGCEMLQFPPSLRIAPDTTQADESSGYDFDIEVPQYESLNTPATPELKSATVTLPPGVSLDPAAADGLRGCPETGSEGINIEGSEATEIGEGGVPGARYSNSPYHDDEEHLAPGHCPAASTVGVVEVSTPVLSKPLEGHLFLAEPKCGGAGQVPCTPADAANGNLFGVYLEAAGSGVIVKLRGTLSVDPATGQLTTHFEENPQLPFSDLTLRIKGGPRAPLANPQTCGQASTLGELVPWSSPITPTATPLSSFDVDWDGNGGACPASLPLAPSFSAGTVQSAANAFSPLTVTLSRGDREQDLAQVTVQTPPGLLGLLSKVTLCEEPLAAAGACPEASRIGSVSVSAGSGSHPYWVQGRVYLTGPYNGAPFGLSIVVPAVAGPFNLGNVNVRATISVNSETSALTVTSGPLPQVIDGVPLRVRTINVTIDRPEFIFNPTNCAALAITGTVAGAQGATAALSTPFAAGGCANLPFKSKFTVSTQAKTSKQNGASLDVKVVDVPGQANVGKVAVTLPKKLPSRLTTIQHACPAATFAANPASCDPDSVIGTATAVTPLLPVKLTGPAYLVSHGGAAFPDLVIILEGENVRVDLTGSINIAKGVTSSTFASLPDVPISSFELALPEGPHSALATAFIPSKAHGSLCGQSLVMPTTLDGQNGAQITQSTKIAVTGCPKAKHKKAKPHKKVKKKRSRGHR